MKLTKFSKKLRGRGNWWEKHISTLFLSYSIGENIEMFRNYYKLPKQLIK